MLTPVLSRVAVDDCVTQAGILLRSTCSFPPQNVVLNASRYLALIRLYSRGFRVEERKYRQPAHTVLFRSCFILEDDIASLEPSYIVAKPVYLFLRFEP